MIPKSIFITGASSGIGAALALAYAKPDRFLALTGRNSDRLKAIAALCRANGAIVLEKTIDVTDREKMQSFIYQCDRLYPLELTLANAGVDGWDFKEEDHYYRTLDVNVGGLLNTVLPSIAVMKHRSRGQIGIISSMAGFRGLPSSPAYSASKAAARVLGEGLRASLASKGIEVSVVTPGFVDSRMTQNSRFPMPFKWSADRAANYIKGKLQKNAGRIAFPWQLYTGILLLNFIPQYLIDRLIGLTPKQKYHPNN